MPLCMSFVISLSRSSLLYFDLACSLYASVFIDVCRSFVRYVCPSGCCSVFMVRVLLCSCSYFVRYVFVVVCVVVIY